MPEFIESLIKELVELKNNDDLLTEVEKNDIQSVPKNLENKKQPINYSDYLTVKNTIYCLLFLGLIGGGFWFFNLIPSNDFIIEYFNLLKELSEAYADGDFNTVAKVLSKIHKKSIHLDKHELMILIIIKRVLFSTK